MSTGSGLFEELKRRNVMRVGVVYLIAAWLLAQVADLMLENFHAPDWVIQAILVVLIIGFPIAVIFAWAFELTPEGIKKERDVDRSQSITHKTGHTLDRSIIAILVVALGYFMWQSRQTPTDPETTISTSSESIVIPANTSSQSAARTGTSPSVAETTTAKSIAVLPFVNMSDDAGNEYFSDGISEEILNSLAKVKELKVAGRTSSFAFKGQNTDIRKIGETLGVDHILEGSVRKFGNQVRITAQLIQVEDGFHLWSESYDRELENLFAIQDEIATAILKELKATLLEGEAEILSVARTDSQAYDLYLLAKQRMYERTRLTLESAADLLDKAIAIDPNYAPAYAQRGIAALLLSVTSYGTLPEDQARSQAKLYLDKALALDENLAEGWAGLGLYYTGPPPQPEMSISVLQKALAINPNLINASNWLHLSYLLVNRNTESMAVLDDIKERDPLYRPGIGNRIFQLTLMDRGEEGRIYLQELEPFMPGDPTIDSGYAFIDLEEGNVARGLTRVLPILEKQPDDRTYKEAVNQGHYLSHQYELVIDDEYSHYIVEALFNQDRNEEAMIVAQKRADHGVVGPLFSFLNQSDQSETLIKYFEQRWADYAAFQRDVPPHHFGYREMADIAYAYRLQGNQQRFNEAMTLLQSSQQDSLDQGMRGSEMLMVVASYHAMAGDTDEALVWLAEAIDGGLIVSTPISHEFPYFRDFDGSPEYEAIQTRMIEHLNNERAQLGLEPVST